MNVFDTLNMIDNQPNPNQQRQDAVGADGGLTAGDVVNGFVNGVDSAVDGLSAANALGCLDGCTSGCAGCSFVFIGLFFTASAAFAMFK